MKIDKTIRIDFDASLAQSIQEGEKPGKIITRAGENVRVLCWDRKGGFPIVALVAENEDQEDIKSYTNDGSYYGDGDTCRKDLLLEAPGWIRFKDGDILACEVHNGPDDYCKWFAVLKGAIGYTMGETYFYSHVSYNYDSYYENGKLDYDDSADNIDSIRLATDEEKQKFIQRLQEENTNKAREILEQFFDIEEKPKCEFEFLQPVLVRVNPQYQWVYGNFTHKNEDWYYISGGIGYKLCIPYNEETKHLLGTTNDYPTKQ